MHHRELNDTIAQSHPGADELLKPYQKAFLEFAIAHRVLRFGEFTLKSGRRSPYFFDTGLFASGATLKRVGEFYAASIIDSTLDFDVLFGPAYKGIPLVTAVAIALAAETGRDTPLCFDRKEAKDHGEGGMIVGGPLSGKVAIVDDVISAGTSVGHSMALINAAGATGAAVYIALDRQERAGQSGMSATVDVANRYGLPVYAIVNLDALLDFLHQDTTHRPTVQAIERYRAEYGA